MKFVAIDEVLLIHDLMLDVGRGRAGVHDFGLLHSAIERPKAQFRGKHLYNSIWFMAAALLQSLVKNHPFEDANKRTAFFSAMRFLRLNGYVLNPPKRRAITFMVNVDIANTDIEDISIWLEKYSKKG